MGAAFSKITEQGFPQRMLRETRDLPTEKKDGFKIRIVRKTRIIPVRKLQEMNP